MQKNKYFNCLSIKQDIRDSLSNDINLVCLVYGSDEVKGSLWIVKIKFSFRVPDYIKINIGPTSDIFQ